MRPSIRFSIAALMGLVLVAAIGLAALQWVRVLGRRHVALDVRSARPRRRRRVLRGALRAVLVARVCNIWLGLPGSCVLVLESLWAAETADSGLARGARQEVGPDTQRRRLRFRDGRRRRWHADRRHVRPPAGLRSSRIWRIWRRRDGTWRWNGLRANRSLPLGVARGHRGWHFGGASSFRFL